MTDELEYTEGSDTCRNYSRITVDTKTIFLKAVAGLVVAVVAYYLVRVKPADERFALYDVLYLAGLTLILLAIVMALVAWHYQSAFEAIRNRLAELDSSATRTGIWTCHALARPPLADYSSTYAMFIAASIIGIATTVVAIGHPSQSESLFASAPVKCIGIMISTGLSAAVYMWLYQDSAGRRTAAGGLVTGSGHHSRRVSKSRTTIIVIGTLAGGAGLLASLFAI